MSSLLSVASDWLYQLNPTLSATPPRADNDGELCFMGPDGTRDGAILCKDLLYGHATCVGSWLLPPEQHIVEGIVVTAVSLLILARTVPKLSQMTEPSMIHIQHPPGARLASLFCFSMMMYYKYSGYPSRVYYVTMPCNMQWALSFIQCFVLPQQWKWAQYTLLQLRLTYIMSVMIAIVTPETDDCILPGEFAFYWFNHTLLLILPAAYVANGSVSCLPQVSWSNAKTSSNVSTWTFNRLWWQFSCAVFSLFYFIPVTLLAIYSGLNLNFMLHPPHDHFALKGKWFRLVATTMLATLFLVSRAIVLGLEKTFRNGRLEAKKKQ
ncbi:Tmem164 family protein [Nitzschia inconspicua]|uniref:Tmem164 family protein n=1 Tax=Nitzschia inconspicua TaxID=303405 RepID=A0A9K3PPZ8_9STRA|nr:Tmem164 family protein [Nitzschia inconspicua]